MKTEILNPQEFDDFMDNLQQRVAEDTIATTRSRPGGGTIDPDYSIGEDVQAVVSMWQEMYNKLHPAHAYYSADQTDSDRPPKD